MKTRPQISMTSYRTQTLFENSSTNFNDEFSNTNTVRKLVQKFQWRVIEHKHRSKTRPQISMTSFRTVRKLVHKFQWRAFEHKHCSKTRPQISMTSFWKRTLFENSSTNLHDELLNTNTVRKLVHKFPWRVIEHEHCSKTRPQNFHDELSNTNTVQKLVHKISMTSYRTQTLLLKCFDDFRTMFVFENSSLKFQWQVFVRMMFVFEKSSLKFFDEFGRHVRRSSKCWRQYNSSPCSVSLSAVTS
jgi:truncated hemoglobin YjbI